MREFHHLLAEITSVNLMLEFHPSLTEHAEAAGLGSSGSKYFSSIVGSFGPRESHFLELARAAKRVDVSAGRAWRRA